MSTTPLTPPYPAAQAVAVRAREQFARHLEAARAQGRRDLAPAPDADAIEAIVDAAFWASLRREEGLQPRISLAFLPPDPAGSQLTFERPLPLSASALAKLAPAVERPGIHLGVWRDFGGELRVWGTTRRLPSLCFVLEVVTSGLLVIKHRSEPFGKFVNMVVLEGNAIKVVDEGRARRPDCPGVLASLLGVELPGLPPDPTNVLVQIAASMRAHGRGGALLVIPAENREWPESIVHPVTYAVDPPFNELTRLLDHPSRDETSHEWQDDLRRAVDALAGLTAVDGATLLTDGYHLMAFGAKITRRRGRPPVERVLVSEPIEGNVSAVANPYQLGGTRHFSAAQFVQDQPDATALVASQDGRFTIFRWSSDEDMVQAHRVEALLL